MQTHPDRLAAVRKFKPLLMDGRLVPRRVFVNSMSDLMRQQIRDAFRDLCFDAMEAARRRRVPGADQASP